MEISNYTPLVDIQKELGSRIKDERIAFNLTQEEMARKSGVSLRTVVNLENGEDVKASSLFRVLQVLNLLGNVDVLVNKRLISPYDIEKYHHKKYRVRKSKSKY